MSTPAQRNRLRPGFRSITPYLLTTGAATDYGDRAANAVDAFGNHWYLATHLR